MVEKRINEIVNRLNKTKTEGATEAFVQEKNSRVKDDLRRQRMEKERRKREEEEERKDKEEMEKEKK